MKKYFILLLLAVIAFIGIRVYQASQIHDHYDTEVHVHADFAIYINDERLDLTGDTYQSSLEKGEKDDDVHLHDENDKVLHRHAEDITFAYFLSTIGFSLTNECFSISADETYCTDENNLLSLYVNEELYPAITSYIPEEEDRILLYYGPRDTSSIQTKLDSVTDEACIHSGTCPERGLPEVESCGLTCDLTVTYVDHTWKEILKFVFLGHF